MKQDYYLKNKGEDNYMAKQQVRPTSTQIQAQLARWLRFRGRDPRNSNYSFSTYREISVAVGLTLCQVREICNAERGLDRKKMPLKGRQFQNLKEIHKKYILADETLDEQKQFSLVARCIQIHRRFPEIKISCSQLRLFYLSQGITYKSMRSKKSHTQRETKRIQNHRLQSYQKLLTAHRDDDLIIYLDETIFQPHSLHMRSWAKKYKNQVMYKQSRTTRTISAAVCVSGNEGIMTYILRQRSIRSQELVQLIEALRAKLGSRPATIFLDNLRAHHSKFFIAKAKDLGFQIIFNAPYSPEFHCIEEVFSIIKGQYKRQILEKNFMVSENKHLQIIRTCIEGIKPETVKKIENRHIKKMEAFVSKIE